MNKDRLMIMLRTEARISGILEIKNPCRSHKILVNRMSSKDWNDKSVTLRVV